MIELATSLDHERGGEISQRLALLYDYIQRRLLEANLQQSDAPLAEVLGLLSTLSEAWAGVRKAQDAPVAESSLVATGRAGNGPRSRRGGVCRGETCEHGRFAPQGSLQAWAILFVEDQAVEDRQHLLAIGADTP